MTDLNTKQMLDYLRGTLGEVQWGKLHDGWHCIYKATRPCETVHAYERKTKRAAVAAVYRAVKAMRSEA